MESAEVKRGLSEALAKKGVSEAIGLIDGLPLRRFLRFVFSGETLDKFCIAPGGRSNHHAFRGGLAYHCTYAAKLANKIVDHYIDLGFEIDKDIVIAGVLLHDIGKTKCYEWNDEDDKANYTQANNLFHHIPVGYGMVLTAATEYNINVDSYSELEQDTLDHLLHIILSHHGNKCWSSPIIPQTIEAYIVHSIEMMDGYVEKYSKGNIPDRIY